MLRRDSRLPLGGVRDTANLQVGDQQPRLRLDQFGAAAAVAAASALVVYVTGGAVMWVRLDMAGLPTDYGLSLVDPRQLLVLGFTAIIGPALITALVLAAATIADPYVGVRFPIITRWSRRIPFKPSMRTWRVAVVLILVPFAIVFVPLGWSTITFVGAVVVAIVLRLLAPTAKTGSVEVPRHFWVGIVIVSLALPLLTTVAQLDGPPDMSKVSIRTNGETKHYRYLVAVTTNYIYVGQRGQIIGIPVHGVRRLAIDQPPSFRFPDNLWDKITDRS